MARLLAFIFAGHDSGHMDIRIIMGYVHATDEGEHRAVEASARDTVKLVFVT
jgi:hypothetical protein